jgi:hypothetical protein
MSGFVLAVAEAKDLFFLQMQVADRGRQAREGNSH